MDAALSQMIFFHGIFAFFYPIFFAANLITLFFTKNYARLIFRIYFVAPMIFLTLFASIFGGITLVFFTREFFSVRIFLMEIFCIFVLFFEIFRAKYLKRAKTSEILLKKYINFCQFFYAFLLFFWAGCAIFWYF